MTENAIQIENLTKVYPKFTLQNLNLTLPTGGIWFLYAGGFASRRF